MLAMDYNRSKSNDKLTVVMSPGHWKSAATNYETMQLNSNTLTATDYKKTKKGIVSQIDNNIYKRTPDYNRRHDRFKSCRQLFPKHILSQ